MGHGSLSFRALPQAFSEHLSADRDIDSCGVPSERLQTFTQKKATRAKPKAKLTLR